VEALTQALQSFSGSLIVVSHDRSFIRRIGTKILEIHQGKASTYPGTYDDYVWSIEKGAFTTLRSTENAGVPTGARISSTPTGEAKGAGGNYKEKKKALDRRLKQLETLINDLDKKMVSYQSQITTLNHELSTGAGDAKTKVQEMGKIQTLLEESESQWIQASEEKETVTREIEELIKGV
jgi:ATP-binding cassette subfamily F protein 3